MKFENFTEFVTLAFWGMKGLMYFTSGPDKLQPSACSSWLRQLIYEKAFWSRRVCVAFKFLVCVFIFLELGLIL